MKKSFELEIIDILIDPIFNSTKKHRLFSGGRSGGKSENVARGMLAFVATSKVKGTLLCTRSIQNAVEDTVYALLVRIIKENELEYLFRIYDKKIVCTVNGNKIIFKGCNALTDKKKESAKRLDNVKWVWFDEAHTATENDIMILIPSIRAEGCVFFYTYNSNADPCYVTSYFKQHPNAEFTHINYYDNPLCPQTLVDEAEALKEINFDLYSEMYLGQPKTDTSKQVIIKRWIDAALELYDKHPENADGQRVYALDPSEGAGDPTGFGQRKGMAFIELDEWLGKDPAESAVIAVERMEKNSHLIFDRVGIGSGVKSTIKEKYPHIQSTPYSNGDSVDDPYSEYEINGFSTGILNKDQFGNFGAQHWFRLRELFENSYRKLNGEDVKEFITINPNIKLLLKLTLELLQIEFEKNTKNQILIVKAPKGTKSPNLADAFMMSYRKPFIIAGIIS